jgi:tetratricopeptide (TPR) repeat protein
VSSKQLSGEVRGRLRSLSKDNAERVGAHLVMAGRLMDIDPELAYQHTQAAVRRAGRIDVVREAAGVLAYRTGRYAEALRELRTAKRINGSIEHLPLIADSERGLGRPERALAVAASEEAARLDAAAAVELAIVVSGARLDLGQPEAALSALDKLPTLTGDARLRVVQARATALSAAGREPEAQALLAGIAVTDLERASGGIELDEEIFVYDVFDDEASNDGLIDDSDVDILNFASPTDAPRGAREADRESSA